MININISYTYCFLFPEMHRRQSFTYLQYKLKYVDFRHNEMLMYKEVKYSHMEFLGNYTLLPKILDSVGAKHLDKLYFCALMWLTVILKSWLFYVISVVRIMLVVVHSEEAKRLFFFLLWHVQWKLAITAANALLLWAVLMTCSRLQDSFFLPIPYLPHIFSTY